jgi:hypothetical protein
MEIVVYFFLTFRRLLTPVKIWKGDTRVEFGGDQSFNQKTPINDTFPKNLLQIIVISQNSLETSIQNHLVHGFYRDEKQNLRFPCIQWERNEIFFFVPTVYKGNANFVFRPWDFKENSNK